MTALHAKENHNEAPPPRPRFLSAFAASRKTTPSLRAVAFNVSYILNMIFCLAILGSGFAHVQSGAKGGITGEDGWLSLTGKAIAGNRRWERKEFVCFIFANIFMLSCGGYCQYLVAIYNDGQYDLSLRSAPSRVRLEFGYSMIGYIFWAFVVGILFTTFAIKKMNGNKIVLFMIGFTFIGSACLGLLHSESRNLVTKRLKKVL